MEDSGIDSGDAKPICDFSSPAKPNNGPPGVPHPKILPRRLGVKNRNQEYKKPSGSLLPLQRLPIPGSKEQQPLVAWDTDESEEEVVSFFGNQKQSPANQELADFSVEELSPTDEDEDGDDLELVIPSGPPANGGSLFFCCGGKSSTCSIL